MLPLFYWYFIICNKQSLFCLSLTPVRLLSGSRARALFPFWLQPRSNLCATSQNHISIIDDVPTKKSNSLLSRYTCRSWHRRGNAGNWEADSTPVEREREEKREQEDDKQPLVYGAEQALVVTLNLSSDSKQNIIKKTSLKRISKIVKKRVGTPSVGFQFSFRVPVNFDAAILRKTETIHLWKLKTWALSNRDERLITNMAYKIWSWHMRLARGKFEGSARIATRREEAPTCVRVLCALSSKRVCRLISWRRQRNELNPCEAFIRSWYFWKSINVNRNDYIKNNKKISKIVCYLKIAEYCASKGCRDANAKRQFVQFDEKLLAFVHAHFDAVLDLIVSNHD